MANETTNFNIGGIDHPVKDPNAVTGVKVGSTTYEPTEGVVDISPAIPDTSGLATKTEVTQGLGEKVDKVTGKQLSTEDYTTTDKTKLANIEAGAEKNVISGIKANGASETLPVDQNGIVTLPPAGSTISPATVAPLEDGTAGVGSSEKYAREDHRHPHDTSKQDALTSSTTLMTINGNAVHYGESVTVQGEKGDKGDTGNVQVDGNGNVLIYNGLDKTTTGAALDASQGQFIGKILNAKDNTFYNVWVGTAAELEALDGDYDDNTIYLVGTVATVAQRFNVTFDGGDHTSIPANTPETAKEGSAFSVVVSAASGYTIDSATGTMAGGGTLTKTENQDGTVTFSTTSVTGAISIQAAATIHIIGITVSAGTRTSNSIQMTAAVNPADADNVTLAWSISEDGTNYSNSTTHFGINSNGVLTIKEGANNASVTVKCDDTNTSSGTASGTLQLTGLSYAEAPITEITDISATRTAANTLTLDATADSSTPTIEYSLVGTVPTVKQVRRWAAGDTVDGEVKESAGNDLIELPAVELSGNTLTYKGDCQVTVRATAGNVTHDETIDITHDNADAIWFEDSAVKTILVNFGHGSNGEITYSQAATSVGTTTNQQNLFKGNTTIKRFNEWQYFSNSNFNVSNCSALESIKLPKIFNLTTIFDSRFGISGTGISSVEIPNGYTAYGASSGTFQNPPIKGSAITEIIFPASITSFVLPIKDMSKITEIDLSTTSISSFPSSKNIFVGSNDVLPKLKTIKFPDTLTSITYAQTIKECKAVSRIEFGTGFTKAYTFIYDGAFGNPVAMTYVFHSTTPPTEFSFASNQSGRRTVDKILVPRSAVDTYKASSVFSSYVDKISAIEDEEA